MQKRKAILHIGTAKTGSTTIQRLLATNRDALVADGFAYPRAPGRNNHMRLAICGAEPRQAMRMARVLGEKGDVADLLEKLHRDLDAEMAALPAAVHTVIFSNEHCYAKINSPEAAERVRAFLSPWFDSFRVLVYLRRQDEFAVSRYTTRLRAGGFEVAVLPSANAEFNADDDDEDMADDLEAEGDLPTGPSQPISRMLDWSAMLDTWAAAFGKGALQPRIFDRREFVGNDLVLDFLHCCGLPDRYAKDARSHNASMRPEAQEFLRRYNELRHNLAVSTGAKAGKVPSAVKVVLARDYSGGGRLPLRSDAEAFMARFEDANERLRALYFPDRARVFSADFSKYPTMPEPLPTDAAVLEVAMHIIGGGKGGAPSAAEEAFLRGEQYVAANRRHKAIEAFREALSLDSSFNKARRALRNLERPASKRRAEGAEAGAAIDPSLPSESDDRAALRKDRPAAKRDRPGGQTEHAAGEAASAERAAPAPEKPKLSEEERAARRAKREQQRLAGQADADARPAPAAEKPKPSEEERAARRAKREQQRPAGKAKADARPKSAADKPDLSEEEKAARRAKREERLRQREATGAPGD